MSIVKKIFFNTISQILAKIIGIALGVTTVAIMARYLGVVGFGQYSTITAYLQFFGILVDFGLQTSMVSLMSNPQNNPQKIFNNAMTLRLISALICFAIAPSIILLFPYDQAIKQGTLILSINYFALAIHQVLTGYFQKELQVQKIALAETIGRVILLIGVIWASMNNLGLFTILTIITVATVIQVALSYLLSLSFNKFRFSFEWPVWGQIFTTSWPIAISIAFNLIYFKADTLILSLTRSQAEVGLYSAPYRILEVLTIFPYLFVGIIFPILTAAWAQNNLERYKKYFQVTFDSLMIVAIPMVVASLLLADKIIMLIAGPEFIASGLILKIIIFATAIIFINTIFGHCIVVINKQKPMIWGYIATAILALTLYLIYIPKYSYIAAAYITVFAELFIFILNFIVVSITTRILPTLTATFKAAVAAGIMALALIPLLSINLILLILIGAAVYLIALFLLGGVKKELIREIVSAKS